MNVLALVIAVLIALIVGAYFRQRLIDSMSNVRVAQEAQEYLKRDSFDITTSVDTYLFTNISVVPKPHKDDDNSDDNTPDNNLDNDIDAGSGDSGDDGDSGGGGSDD